MRKKVLVGERLREPVETVQTKVEVSSVRPSAGLLDNFATGSWTRLTFDHYRSIHTIIVAADELLI